MTQTSQPTVRKSEVIRDTTETQIKCSLTIEGQGKYNISTGINFFDHMLELLTRHGVFNIDLNAKGDLHIDQHHLVEDTGIVLGEAFNNALGDKKGINRAGYFVMPMDETLAVAAIDFSGRPHSTIDTQLDVPTVGDLESELVDHFFESFASSAKCNLHIKVLYGKYSHHKVEGCFKAFARALRVACSQDKQLGEMLPSTKELL